MPLEAPDQVFFAPHNQMRLQQLVEFFFDKLPSGALLGKNYWTATSMCWTASLTTVTRLIICDKCHGVHEWASSNERIRHRLDFLSQMGVGRSGELRCTCLATAALIRKRRSNADARNSIKEAKARKAAAGTSASAASPSGASMEP